MREVPPEPKPTRGTRFSSTDEQSVNRKLHYPQAVAAEETIAAARAKSAQHCPRELVEGSMLHFTTSTHDIENLPQLRTQCRSSSVTLAHATSHPGTPAIPRKRPRVR